MIIDEKQGFLNFSEPEKGDTSEPEEKGTEPENSCQYCPGSGACMFCGRGKIETKRLKEINDGKKVKKGHYYAKQRWRR